MIDLLEHLFFFMAADSGGGAAGEADTGGVDPDTGGVDPDSDGGDPGGDGGAADAESFPTWMEQNKGDLKKHPDLKQFETPSALSQAYLDLKGKIESDGFIEVPSEDAGDAERKAFWKKIGRPDTYDVPKEILENASFNGVDALFDRLNLTEAQAAGIVEFLSGVQANTAAAEEKQRAENYDTFLKTAKAVDNWGTDYDANMVNVGRFINAFGGDALKDALRSTGAVNNFAVMDAIAKVSRLLGPGYFTTGKISPPAPSKGLQYKTEI